MCSWYIVSQYCSPIICNGYYLIFVLFFIVVLLYFNANTNAYESLGECAFGESGLVICIVVFHLISIANN